MIALLFLTNQIIAGVAQLAEHDVANVVVEGSNPFARSSSLRKRLWLWLEPFAVSGPSFTEYGSFRESRFYCLFSGGLNHPF